MSVSSLFLVSRVSAAAWTSLQTVPFFGFFHPMQRCLCECWSMPGHTYILSFSPSCSKPLIPTQHWQNKGHFTDQPWICPTAHPLSCQHSQCRVRQGPRPAQRCCGCRHWWLCSHQFSVGFWVWGFSTGFGTFQLQPNVFFQR